MSAFPSCWPAPQPVTHTGAFVTLTPASVEQDAVTLHAISHGSEAALDIWKYLPCGPFAEASGLGDWLRSWQSRSDVVAFTVRGKDSGQPVGTISIMRITPEHGVAELGFIWYTPAVQRSSVNTETIYLLLRYLFEELKYRRVEWKCDDRNARSKAAALRLGFRFEGLFRQHLVVKDQNRDTAWFAMLDSEWPQRKAHFERVLYSGEKVSLSELNRSLGD